MAIPVLSVPFPILPVVQFPKVLPPPASYPAITCILKPDAANPAHIAVRRNTFALEETADEAAELELTVPLDDLPRLLAYSATAIKQPSERFQTTL